MRIMFMSLENWRICLITRTMKILLIFLRSLRKLVNKIERRIRDLLIFLLSKQPGFYTVLTITSFKT